MAGTLLYGLGLNYGSNWNPWIYESDGTRTIPCIIGDSTPVPQERRSQFRARPTGESGSGPYFVSYLTPSSGGYWLAPISSEDRLVTSLDTVCYDCNGGLGAQVHFYTDGVKAYSCGTGGGAYAGSVGWNYIIRKDDKFYHSQEWFYPSTGKVYTWQEAEAIMEDRLSLLERWPEFLVRYTDCFYRPTEQSNNFDWRLGEHDAFFWYDLTGVLPRGYQVAATQSYIAAADALPVATTNTIANVLQSAAAVSNILHGDFSPKSIKDVWLRYRYEYCTTKMDIEEYASLTRRLVSLATAEKVNCRGRFEYQGVSCETSFDVDSSQWMPNDVASWLKTYGFRFSAVNAWDMIPYSFVVDWFLHISDLLEAFQKQGDAISLQVTDCWHTFQTDYDGQFTMFRVPKAIRWGVPYVSYQPASAKTIGKRITDAIALFLC